MAAHQAPSSLGFSRQEHWNGLPFPSPMHQSENWKWSCSVVSDSSRPHGPQPTRLLHPWDFPGESTGVGCHCLLQISASKVQKNVYDVCSWTKLNLSDILTGINLSNIRITKADFEEILKKKKRDSDLDELLTAEVASTHRSGGTKGKGWDYQIQETQKRYSMESRALTLLESHCKSTACLLSILKKNIPWATQTSMGRALLFS